MRTGVLTCISIVTLLFAAGAVPAVADANADFKSANAAYDGGNYAEAERICTGLLKADLSQAGRASVFILRGIARNAQGKYAASVMDLTKALPLADKANKGIIRFDRMLPLLSLEKFDDAYKDLLAMAQSYPAVVKDVTMRNVFAVGRHLLKNERHDDLLTLLLALKKTGYRGPDSLASTDYLYIYLVRELADHKRADEAAPLIAEFTEYDALLEHFAGSITRSQRCGDSWRILAG